MGITMWTSIGQVLFLSSILVSSSYAKNPLPSFDFQERKVNEESLRDDGNKIGAFVVRNLGENYKKSVENFYAEAPGCLGQNSELPRLGMNDGSLRTTFASGTGKYPDCLSEEMEIMSNTFDQVDQIVSDIIEVVVGNELKYQDEKTVYDLKDSPLKEHVHIYTKSNDFDGIDEYMVPFHMDNGLYLMITPYPGHGLKIKTSSGTIMDTDSIESDSILVLMGRGLVDWILVDHEKRSEFHAVPHAVESLKTEAGPRSIFARMKSAPLDAFPINGGNKFNDVFFNHDIIHANIYSADNYTEASKSMCEEGYEYCWMGCMPAPSCGSGQQLSCSNTQNVDCCSTYNDEPCEDMDGTCHWECVDEENNF